ncbi:hypothetical protein CNE_BB2p00430 (plasmid) [Cupriavidus necator N-1]|uniref:LysR family transcriptional regulator n=1 Tax=Cupriavidus necator (strain ATCC 43291 / DSM 13513 / CCUG 52238 / LMG 8453 / N-1) TaxID=1042878 RepID=F8GYB8_CUPNN|nr:hypothetical protein CNE_BB2p00430 [Cupriavidus necator N-1]
MAGYATPCLEAHRENALGAQAEIHDRPRYVTGDMIAMPLAAVAGVGVCQLPVMRVWD